MSKTHRSSKRPRHPASSQVAKARCVALCLGLVVQSALGDITYNLNFNPANSPEEQQVANSVAAAAAFYNQYGSFNKHWSVSYNAGIPTAQANINGDMGFGGSRNERVVFHEAGHTFGMGTHWTYGGLIAGGLWKGKYGNQAQFEGYNDYTDGLHGDGHAIWPGGFNYDNEDGFLNRIWHIRVMAGIRADMGILSFTREARNEAVVARETAEFKVESPMAASWQWYKDGQILPNGGDVSGATTSMLRIANADATDAGAYLCAATGAGETLWSRPRQLWVHAAPKIGHWTFNGNANDSGGANHGTAFGTPAYVTGKVAQAVDLDGADDYIDLPDPIGRTRETTIATWVNWDGGGDWQRVFDFGTGTLQYLLLTPKAGGGGLRLALFDPINGKDIEYQVNAPTLTTGQWIHLAVVLRENYMTLYRNGQALGSVEIQGSPADFPATNNYIGKSQFADPLFNGRVDDFQVHSRALNGQDVWALWGQSANQAPSWSAAEITLPSVNALQPLATNLSLAPHANDPESNPLTFSKVLGPTWLTVAANGPLSGQPGAGNLGENVFIVRVTDSSGANSDATLKITAFGPPAAPVTANLSAPTVDSDDVSFFASNIGEPDTINGTTASGDNDESTYVSEDRSSKGQTFTTGPGAQGYFMQSFTVQHVNWPTLTPNGTFYDLQPGDQWEFQIGTMNGTTKTPLLQYTATYDGGALAAGGNTGTGNYLTFNLSGLNVQLAPNTTYYFEIAPLSGNPFFEMNSSRTGTYAEGTAFRGGTAGTIGTTVNTLAGDYIFHVNLEAKSTVPAGTVAWWNFEEGAANSYVSYNRSVAGLYEGSIFDQSGNANHLSVFAANWHWYRPQVPAAITPQSGAANTLSIQNAGGFPAISSTGTFLRNWSPTSWTIEAAIRPDDATNGFQTFIGRDSYGAFSGNPALAAMYFTVLPNGGLRFMFTDAAGNNWDLSSAANTLQDGKWHAVAATSDGSTVSLYRKNLTNGDTVYTLLGTLNIAASPNPALSTGSGSSTDWTAGDFTLARGLYNGGHTDRFFGHIDDVRFSAQTLAADQLLHSTAPQTPSGLSAATASGSQINLTWSASNGATRYNVKRSLTVGGTFANIATGITSNSYSDTGLPNGATRYYVVNAENAAGTSADSTAVSATTWTASQAWRMINFGTTNNTGNAADTSDPDKDGLNNLLEYALGSNPNGNAATAAPQVSTATGKLRIAFTRNTAATDLTLSVVAADSLTSTWSEIARSTNGAAFTAIAPGALVSESGSGTVRNVETTDIVLITDPAHPKRFMRLEVRR